MMILRTLICLFSLATISALAQSKHYRWKQDYTIASTIVSRIQPPPNFARIAVVNGSFAEWLVHLPLKTEDTPVLMYNGKKKANQSAHHSVIDIDTGERDLQQCADAIMRLRAEYLYSKGAYHAIHFNFTSGDEASFARWLSGYRPLVDGNQVTWEKLAEPDSSYAGFREYLEVVFTYAGTHSLSRELKARRQLGDIRIGDVFIKGGFPGHAIIVVDMACDSLSGEKVFLLAQGYTPAQDMHILKNPVNGVLSPWFQVPSAGSSLIIPEWTFRSDHLMYFNAQ